MRPAHVATTGASGLSGPYSVWQPIIAASQLPSIATPSLALVTLSISPLPGSFHTTALALAFPYAATGVATNSAASSVTTTTGAIAATAIAVATVTHVSFISFVSASKPFTPAAPTARALAPPVATAATVSATPRATATLLASLAASAVSVAAAGVTA